MGDRQTQTDTDRQTNSDRHRQRQTDRQTQIQTETDSDRQRQTATQTATQMETDGDRERHRDTDRQTDRQTDSPPHTHGFRGVQTRLPTRLVKRGRKTPFSGKPRAGPCSGGYYGSSSTTFLTFVYQECRFLYFRENWHKIKK